MLLRIVFFIFSDTITVWSKGTRSPYVKDFLYPTLDPKLADIMRCLYFTPPRPTTPGLSNDVETRVI